MQFSLQRDVAQLVVKGKFGGRQFPGACDLFKISAVFQPQPLQGTVDLVGVGRNPRQLGKQVVGLVVRRRVGRHQGGDGGVIDFSGFAHVHKPDNVPQRLGVVGAVKEVNFHPGDVDPGGYVGQGAQPLFKIVVKKLPQKEMPVFVITGRYDFKWPPLRGATGAALYLYGRLLSPLRGGQRCHKQLAELQLRLYAKQVLRSGDQAVVEGQAYISYFQFFQYVFLEPRVFHFHIVLKVE